MRSQRDREEQSVAIASAMGVVVLVLAAAGLCFWLLPSDVHVSDTVVRGAILLAVVAGLVHLVRSERR